MSGDCKFGVGELGVGPGAPDSFESGYETQVWLAVSEDAAAKVSGRYFYHKKESPYNKEADDEELQERLMSLCEEITGSRKYLVHALSEVTPVPKNSN